MSLHEVIVNLIRYLGPVGVGLGAALEGETAVVVGGALARGGLFSPWLGGLAAFTGSFILDQLLFGIGRYRRRSRFVQKVRQKPAFAGALGFLHRHPLPFCLGFRFAYGFRVIGPLTIGVSDISARRFAIINFCSAGIWAALFTMIGYRFQPVLTQLWRRLAAADTTWIIAAGLTLVVLAAIFITVVGRYIRSDRRVV